MLLTFHCKVYPDITFFGDVGLALLHAMGHSGTIPSAVVTADVPKALHQLQRSLCDGIVTPASSSQNDAHHDLIDIKKRAIPLIDLLESAIENHCDVMWTSTES